MAPRSHDAAGNLLPLRRRRPGVYWVAMLVIAAMLLTVAAAIISVL